MAKPRFRIDTNGENLRPIAVPMITRGGPSAEYMRGTETPFFFNWTPALRDERDDVRSGYIRAAGRAIDAIHNSGWLKGAVEQSLGAICGAGLSLAAKPDKDVLGWTEDEANKWARDVERRFEAWAQNPIECDAAGVQSLGQQQRSVMKFSYSHGEALGLLPYVRRAASQSGPKVKLLPPHKLVQDSDGDRLFQGVHMADWNFPVGYKIMLRVQQTYEEKIDIPARDELNRPQVIHIVGEPEPDAPRGITMFAPALRVVRQYDQLADATLQAALIQAIFAATVESQAPTMDILNALQDSEEQGVSGSMDGYMAAKSGWYKNTKIDLGRPARIAHLFPGEKLEFKASETPNATYEAFAKFLLREIARCLGLTFETLTGDYSGATYSSVRMATSEIWPVIMSRRTNIVARFCQLVYEAWLDEEISAGRVPFKGGVEEFREKRAAAARASWRGPPKPQADDLKTQRAHEGYKRMGVLTDEAICSDLGYDWEDAYEQRQREMNLRKKLGLPETDTMAPPPVDPVGDRLVTQD